MTKLYRKKPVVIEAIKWDGTNEYHTLKFCNFGLHPASNTIAYHDGYSLNINTLEGVHRANVGDFIIKGVKGEFYPCKPDIFALTYDEVQDA